MGKLIVAIAVGIVFVVLCLGLWTLFRGGQVAASWSNKLMRLRVAAQASALRHANGASAPAASRVRRTITRRSALDVRAGAVVPVGAFGDPFAVRRLVFDGGGLVRGEQGEAVAVGHLPPQREIA